MSPSKAKTTLKYFLLGLSKGLFFVAVISFLFGGRAIHEFAGVERVLSEVIGIAIAVACGFGGVIAKRGIEDIEWEEANEDAFREQSESRAEQK